MLNSVNQTYLGREEVAKKPFAVPVDLLLKLQEYFWIADGRLCSVDVLLLEELYRGMELG